MFIKSALAMLITVGFAGGAVYYGTNENPTGRQTAPNEVDLRAPQKLAVNKPTGTGASSPTSVKAIETTEKGKVNDHPEIEKTQPVTAETQIAIKETSSVVPGSVPIAELEPEFVADPEDSVEMPTLKTTPEFVKPEFVKPEFVKPEFVKDVPNPNINLARIMPLLMVQAEKISTPEIKDQAYLDIVNFSVSQGQFKFADAAMQKINQPELRDTARSQIAIGLALGGRADDAFEVIDAVEIDTLRDVMRLQVIEALIVPEKLPSGLIRR